MIDLAGLLFPLLPPDRDQSLPVGHRMRWPGDDRVWVWNGREWVGERTEFEGGDEWGQSDVLDL